MITKKRTTSTLASVVGSALFTLLAAPAVLADDTEIFVGQSTTASAPNIMFIMDTSGSMGTVVNTTAAYDPNIVYAGTGSCGGISGRVYYSTGNNPPACNSGNYITSAQQRCADANVALAAAGLGVYGPANLIRWVGGNGSNPWRWRQNSFGNALAGDVDCQADALTSPYPKAQTYLTNAEKNSSTSVYTTTLSQSYWANNPSLNSYRLFSANYVVYYNQFRTATLGTRMSIMQAAATQMLGSLSGVNVGLMRYSDNGGNGDLLASGGYVVAPATPIETSRASLIATVNGFTANGYTPLSETLFEAERYFSGGAVLYGNSSVPARSVASSRLTGLAGAPNYDSPAEFACQKNYVVYLTDGLPTADSEANTLIKALPNFAALGGSCLAAGSGPDSGWPDSGLCLGALAQYMFNADLRPGSGDPAGQQNVRSYFIGLGSDFVDTNTNQLNAAFDYLNTAATRGGGQAYQASDLSGLSDALSEIVNSIRSDAQSFAAPTVGVNAFNRTRNLDELYISLFQPSATYHWPGNVKKYKLAGGVLVDQAGSPAVDSATGLFKDTSQELWSSVVDGNNVLLGGAAAQLPIPSQRKLYTYLDNNKKPAAPVDITGSGYVIEAANASVSDALLGTGVVGQPTRTQLIDWMHGVDVQDENSNGNTTEARKKIIGDPLHAQPAVVVYGGTVANPDAVLYTATNDGYLHAFNAATGAELWAYVPEEMLGDQIGLYADDPLNARHYGLDGDIRVEKFDINRNGIVDGNDRVILYFGMGRGGNHYYALDVTDKTTPRFVWSLGSGDLPGVGQTWSPPMLTSINIASPPSAQNSQRLVLIFGGGYDPAEDGTGITGAYVASDSVGNRIFMVDAITGALLWSAGPSGASLNLTRMDHAIPSAITVLDLNGDGYADRMYVGDMAGQLWRFDIFNGQNTANLVTGGVIASLGAHDISGNPTISARRFYAPPDVAFVSPRGVAPYFNIAIGSGYRGHPLNTGIRDNFYSFRDFNVANKLTQAQYNSYVVVQDAGMTDITDSVTPTIAATAPGWKLRLDQNGGWIGEKVLGSATTIGGRILFTTYTPSSSQSNSSCVPNTGTNRVYAISINDGAPVVDANGDGTQTTGDRSLSVASGSIVSEVTVLLEGDGRIGVNLPPQSCTAGSPGCTCDVNGVCTQPAPQCVATDPNCTCPADGSPCFNTNPDIVCVAGVSSVPVCAPLNRLKKTFWRDNAAN